MVFQMPYPIVGFERFVCHTLIKELSLSAPAVFNEDLLKTFFVSQWLTNATSFPLNSSISSKHVLAVGDFGARKKQSFETWHFWFNFPHPTQAKVKFPTPWAQKVVKCQWFARVWEGGGGGVGGNVEVSIWLAHNLKGIQSD